MMSLGQKVIAIVTILLLNLLVVPFFGVLVVVPLIPSLGLIAAILKR